MELETSFIKDFLLHLKKSGTNWFSYNISFNSKDRDLLDHIGALDYTKLVEREEFNSYDSFNGRVRITQRGLDYLGNQIALG